MIKKFFAAIFLIFMIATAVWLAENQGSVTLDWLGYEVTTSVAVLLGTLGVLFIVLALGIYVLLTLLHLPLHWRDKSRLKRQQQGIDYAGKALIALASQQGDLAASFAKRAHNLLSEHSFTLLLQAQAAQLQQNTPLTTQLYTAMTKRPETIALGMRGLITNARKKNAPSTTKKLITDFYYAHPENEWAAENFIQEIIKQKNWDAAEQAVSTAIIKKTLPRAVGQQALQSVLIEKSRLLPTAEALPLLNRAYTLDKKNIPVVVAYAHALQSTNETLTRSILYKTWKKTPHPALAKAFQKSLVPLEPFAAYKQVKYFIAPHAKRVSSLLLLSNAEKTMGILGKAKELAVSSLKISPSKEAYILLAEIAASASETTSEVQSYQKLAEETAAILVWSCRACDNAFAEWHATCPHCDGFMTTS